MEKKKISGKVIAVAVLVVAAVSAAVIFLIMHFTKKDETYRSIQIYELKGSTIIERNGIGKMEAVENLYLESGDRLIVGDNSSARLKLDDDKYVLVEENSVLSIVAEGSKENSRTSINLEQGTITNEIRNKLSANSTYNVSTPNSVMAVRGTVFRVKVSFDDNGEVYTKVVTYEGKVANNLVFPDGTKQEEFIIIEGGKETTIHMDTKITEYVVEPTDIDYSQTPVEVLEFLKEIVENGTDLADITLDEIKQMIEQVSPDNIETEPATEEETETETETEEETETEKETTVALPEYFTVTFSYEGAVFGTQTVKKGEKAAVPSLAPAKTGAWDFDFSQEITEDVTINWKTK